MNQKKWRSLSACGVMVLLTAGCTPADEQPKPPAQNVSSVSSLQSQIQTVQNNPKIPPGQKAMILGNLQSAMARAQAKSSAGAAGAPSKK